MAKEYKVKCLSLGGPGNKIYKKGNIVTQANFPKSKMEDLVKDGSLVEVETPPEEKKSSGMLESISKGLFNDSEKTKSIDDFKPKELKNELRLAGVSFDVDSTKEQLYDLWLGLKK